MTERLVGKGVEIGAGNLPMVFENEVEMTYIDQSSQEELQKIFPEIQYPQLKKVVIGNVDEPLAVASNAYDFLVASHVIEHLKNPFKSLEYWCSVVKEGGYFLSFFPTGMIVSIKADPIPMSLTWHKSTHYPTILPI